MSKDTKPSLEEVEAAISVSNDEILAAVSKEDPLLVQAVAARLQNQKMKKVLREHFGDDED